MIDKNNEQDIIARAEQSRAEQSRAEQSRAEIIVIGSLNPQKTCQDRVRVLSTQGICQAIRATDYKDPPKIVSK